MRYWAYFIAKLAAIAGVGFLLQKLLIWVLPVPAEFRRFGHNPVGHDLLWTTVFMAYTMLIFGLIWLAVLDQRYRCRTCLARLRMPLETGSWSRAMLFAPPRTEYICPWGHGTMKVREVQITGLESPRWDEHEDMWKELESLGKK